MSLRPALLNFSFLLFRKRRQRPNDFLILNSAFLLARLARVPGIHHRAEIRRQPTKRENQKGGQRVAAIIEGKIMNLSVETKVAIVVATSFILLVVGAMAQG